MTQGKLQVPPDHNEAPRSLGIESPPRAKADEGANGYLLNENACEKI